MVVGGSARGALLVEHSGGIHPCQQTGGDVTHIAFHASDLPGKEQIFPVLVLQRRP